MRRRRAPGKAAQRGGAGRGATGHPPPWLARARRPRDHRRLPRRRPGRRAPRAGGRPARGRRRRRDRPRGRRGAVALGTGGGPGRPRRRPDRHGQPVGAHASASTASGLDAAADVALDGPVRDSDLAWLTRHAGRRHDRARTTSPSSPGSGMDAEAFASVEEREQAPARLAGLLRRAGAARRRSADAAHRRGSTAATPDPRSVRAPCSSATAGSCPSACRSCPRRR